MLNEFFDWNAWVQWFGALDRAYIFLLALPFVVAVIGLWSWWIDKEDIDQEYEARATQSLETERRQSERRRAERRRGTHVHGLR